MPKHRVEGTPPNVGAPHARSLGLSSTGVERRYGPAEAIVVIGKIAIEFPSKMPLWAVLMRRGADHACMDVSYVSSKMEAGI